MSERNDKNENDQDFLSTWIEDNRRTVGKYAPDVVRIRSYGKTFNRFHETNFRYWAIIH